MASVDPALARLVERQLASWEIGSSQRLSVPSESRPETQDFICISRQVGVDIGDIGQELGRRLGWPVFHRDLLDRMAGDDQTRRRLYATMDGRDLGWAESILRPLLLGMERRDDYFHRLVDLVLAMVRQAPAIFVGRGIDLMLPRERGLRVRLTAGEAYRRGQLARETGLSAEGAAAELARVEREREQFIRHHFRCGQEDPARFDLALNVERWEPIAAADLILAARERLRRP